MNTTIKHLDHDQSRTFPWEIAGAHVTGSLADVLDAGGLSGWNVRAEPLQTDTGIHVPGKWATIRDTKDGPSVLGVVGGRYQIAQNEEAFAPITDILDTSDLEPDTAGIWHGGRQAFITLHLPEGILIGGQDKHEARLLALTSHDGSTSVKFAVIIGRLACFNALRPSLKGALSSWSLRHTSGLQWRVEEARRSLQLTFGYLDEFSVEMEKLLDKAVSDDQFQRITERLIPIKAGASEGWAQNAADRRETMMNLFSRAETNEFGRGTAYAALNATIEYSDHFTPLRGADPDGMKWAQRTMAIGGATDKFKNRAQAMIGALR